MAIAIVVPFVLTMVFEKRGIFVQENTEAIDAEMPMMSDK